MNCRHVLAAGLAAIAACATPVAGAQTASYPSQPIRLVIGWTAGGATDILARQLAAHMARQLEAMREQLSGRDMDSEEWQKIVRSDQMKAVLRATATGEPLPDTQWNRILSSLDKGLWQVRRRTPPEEYRQAIEQYQDRIRRLTGWESTDDPQP